MKRIISVILLFAFIASVCACTGVKNQADNDAVTQSVSPQYEADYHFDPETDVDNRYANAPFCICELDNAFIWHEDRTGLFYYCDKETGDSGVFCGKPECEHNSPECSANVSAMPGISYYKGKLYWLVYNNINDTRYIYRMNTDSSDMEAFMAIPEVRGQDVSLNRVFIHREKIFLERYSQFVTDGVPVNRYRLSVCDFQEHDASKEKTILEFDSTDSSSGNILVYFLGDRLYLMSNYRDEVRKLMIWTYDLEKEETSVAAEIPLEVEMFYSRSFKATPEGDIYVGQMGFYPEHETKAYKVEDNRLVPFMEFDEEFSGAVVNVCDDVIIAAAQITPMEPEYKVWVRDYDGNTIYKGELSTKFNDGLSSKWEFGGYRYLEGSRERLIFELFEHQLNGTARTSKMTYLIEYDFTENGLEEKTILAVEVKQPS